MRLGGSALLCVLLGFFCVARAFIYVDAPVQLLDVNQDHSRFELVDQGLDFLRSIKGPFAIIAVGGAAKSGKSSLLNQILNVSNSVGFDVSAGFKPGTLGIFFWGRPFQALVNGTNVTVIFMDSEGLGSNENPTAYDQKLCLLTVLIASDFYYNVLNGIMKDNVNLLHSAVQLYSLFEKDQLSPPFPHLFWVVQSYQFDLGSQTSEEYLQWALQPKEIPADGAASEDVIHFNEVVTALSAFPPSPVPRILLMDFPKQGVPARELVRYGWNDFDPGFKAQLLQLKQLMLSRVHIKRFSAGPIEGEFLARLIVETIVPGLNRIDTIVPEYLRQLAEDLLEKCFAQYTLNMTKYARLPQRESHILTQHSISANLSLETFATNCTGGLVRSQNQACYDELHQKVNVTKELLLRQNLDENKRLCRELLDEEWNNLLKLRLCEDTCDIRDYEQAKKDFRRRYEDRDKEYMLFQKNRMKDNDERFAVKCAQRCFKTIIGSVTAFAFCIFVVSRLFSLCGPAGSVVSAALVQLTFVLLGCTALLIASYMEVVAFLPWTTAATYVYPWLDLPLRVARLLAAICSYAGPFFKAAYVHAQPLLSTLSDLSMRAVAALGPLGKLAAQRIGELLKGAFNDESAQQHGQLVLAGALAAVAVLLMSCCICSRRPRSAPSVQHIGFRVRALD